MKTSEKIDILLPALFKAKGELRDLVKSSDNPYFSSTYADLNTHLEGTEPILRNNGFIILQPVVRDERGSFVETILMHASGQYISSQMDLVSAKGSMQDLGSAVTYARRYTLGSILALRAVDDDGNAATGLDLNKKAVNKDFKKEVKETKSSEPVKTQTVVTNETATSSTNTIKSKPTPFRRPNSKAVPTTTTNGSGWGS